MRLRKTVKVLAMSDEAAMNASRLTGRHCVPCEVGTQPFDRAAIEGLLPTVPKWKLEGSAKIIRSLRFSNFVEGMRFINNVADLAEAESTIRISSSPTTASESVSRLIT